MLILETPEIQTQDAVVERWLRDDVLPAYDLMLADPKRGLSAEQVLAAMRAHHDAHVKKAVRGA